MTLATACPKPVKRTASDRRVDRLVNAWARRDRWRTKAIAKAEGKSRPRVRQRNEQRIARKAKRYRQVIASVFNKRLRYLAYERSSGLCECSDCIGWRTAIAKGGEFRNEDAAAIALAVTEIPCWFVKGGGEPFRRFRSTEGELHHVSYKHFGDENPAEIAVVQWTWKACHQRIEAEHGTRPTLSKGRLLMPRAILYAHESTLTRTNAFCMDCAWRWGPQKQKREPRTSIALRAGNAAEKHVECLGHRTMVTHSRLLQPVKKRIANHGKRRSQPHE